MGLVEAPDAASLAAYLFMWGVFTAVMFVGTLKISRGLQVVFATLAVLFPAGTGIYNRKRDCNHHSGL